MPDGTTTTNRRRITLITRFESLDQVLEAIASTSGWILFTRRAYRDYEAARFVNRAHTLDDELSFLRRSCEIRAAAGWKLGDGPHFGLASRHKTRRLRRGGAK